jgi:hypothetical protein
VSQAVDNRVPTRGGVGRTHGSSRRSSKDGGYGNIPPPKTPRTGFFRRWVILRTAAARPCRSSGCDPPPSCVASRLAPRGDLKLSHGWRLLASAVPQRYFPAVRRELQHNRPSADPSVPFFAKTHFANAAPAPSSGEYLRVFSRGKDISDLPSGRSMFRFTDIMFFQNPSYMASRQVIIPRIAAAGTSFSPLPCQAWHGYKATTAQRVEVEVGVDGPASAPLSRAAAAAPPAGATTNVETMSESVNVLLCN